MTNLILNFIITSSLVVCGFIAGLMQSQPSPDIISLILGPLGAVVLLILITWYLTKRNKEKELKIEKLQETIVANKDKEIERLQKELDNN